MSFENIKNQNWRVVKIIKKVAEGYAFQATGFAIPRGKICYIVTNNHVIHKAGIDSIFFVKFLSPINGHEATLCYQNNAHDLAILRTNVEVDGGEENTTFDFTLNKEASIFTLGFDELSIFEEKPNFQKGEIKLALPYVKDKSLFITSGTYNGETTNGFLVKNIKSLGGSSGSPVFNENGAIIGYLIARHNDAENEAIGISIQKAVEMINSGRI